MLVLNPTHFKEATLIKRVRLFPYQVNLRPSLVVTPARSCSNVYVPFTPGIVISAFTLPAQTLIFGSMGNTKDSGSITLRNTHDRTKTIRLFGGTGNVTVE